jgi:Tfp pilus assembly protein PilX
MNGKIGRPGAVMSRQRGAALVIGLIMLVLITIVSLSVMQGVREQESMAGSAGRLTTAFERAEAGLRGLESGYVHGSLLPADDVHPPCRIDEDDGAGGRHFTAPCYGGTTAPRDYTKMAGWTNHNVYQIALYGDASPWYVTEQLPNAKSSATLTVNSPAARYDLKVFRITTLGADPSRVTTAADLEKASSVVVLQSVVTTAK